MIGILVQGVRYMEYGTTFFGPRNIFLLTPFECVSLKHVTKLAVPTSQILQVITTLFLKGYLKENLTQSLQSHFSLAHNFFGSSNLAPLNDDSTELSFG